MDIARIHRLASLFIRDTKYAEQIQELRITYVVAIVFFIILTLVSFYVDSVFIYPGIVLFEIITIIFAGSIHGYLVSYSNKAADINNPPLERYFVATQFYLFLLFFLALLVSATFNFQGIQVVMLVVCIDLYYVFYIIQLYVGQPLQFGFKQAV